LLSGGFDSIAVSNSTDAEPGIFCPADIRKLYTGKLMVNGGYDQQSAEAALASGHADAVSLGRPFYLNAPMWSNVIRREWNSTFN